MGTDYSLQLTLFVVSVLTGIFLGIVYDAFRLLRVAVGGNKTLVFVEDMVFCIFAAISMILLLFNLSHGQIRLFAFVGAGAGFAAYYLTVGQLTRRIFLRIRAYLLPRYQRQKQRIKAAVARLKSKILYHRQLRFYQKGCGIKI